MTVLVKHVRHLPVWGDLLSFTVPGGEKFTGLWFVSGGSVSRLTLCSSSDSRNNS